MSHTVASLLHGTLDALVLKTLSFGPRHGYAIARWIEDASGEDVMRAAGTVADALAERIRAYADTL